MQWFDGHKHVDLMLPEGRIDVEVDGMQHLTNPKQIVADLDRGHFTHKQRGYDTIHIPNQFLYAHLDEIAHGLAEAVRLRRERVQRPVPIIVKTA
jgi:very-short-patch-repair endonuclease